MEMNTTEINATTPLPDVLYRDEQTLDARVMLHSICLHDARSCWRNHGPTFFSTARFQNLSIEKARIKTFFPLLDKYVSSMQKEKFQNCTRLPRIPKDPMTPLTQNFKTSNTDFHFVPTPSARILCSTQCIYGSGLIFCQYEARSMFRSSMTTYVPIAHARFIEWNQVLSLSLHLKA